MKTILVKLLKIILILIGIEFVLFILMGILLMSDQQPHPLGRIIYSGIKYVLGFPLVLVNDEYPFFLERAKWPNTMIPLVLLNNLILAGTIIWIVNLFKKR